MDSIQRKICASSLIAVLLSLSLSCRQDPVTDNGQVQLSTEEWLEDLQRLSVVWDGLEEEKLADCATLQDSINHYTRILSRCEDVRNVSVEGRIISFKMPNGLPAEISLEKFIADMPAGTESDLPDLSGDSEYFESFQFGENEGELVESATEGVYSFATKAFPDTDVIKAKILFVQPFPQQSMNDAIVLNDAGEFVGIRDKIEKLFRKGDISYLPEMKTINFFDATFENVQRALSQATENKSRYSIFYIASHGRYDKQLKKTSVLFYLDISKYLKMGGILNDDIIKNSKLYGQCVYGHRNEYGAYMVVTSDLMGTFIAPYIGSPGFVINASCEGLVGMDMANAFIDNGGTCTYIGSNKPLSQSTILPMAKSFICQLLKGYSVKEYKKWLDKNDKGKKYDPVNNFIVKTRGGIDYSLRKTISSRPVPATRAEEQVGLGCCHIDIFEPYAEVGRKMYCGLVFSKDTDDPRVNDGKNSKVVYTELDHEISEGEDYIFSMNNLDPESTYYWRAFMCSNYPDGAHFFYADEVYDFTTDSEENDFRRKLIQLYHDTGGPNWTHNDNWCSDKPIEQWYGIHQDAEGLYSLDLHENNLQGAAELNSIAHLYRIDFSNNRLTSLDVSGNKDLGVLHCYNNQLSSLDFSNCGHLYLEAVGDGYFLEQATLKEVDCSYNFITSLYFANSRFNSLSCSYNRLSSIDLTDHNIGWLYCDNNQISELKLHDIWYIDCSNNNLSSLDCSGWMNLGYLYCSGNQLTSLKLPIECCYLEPSIYVDCSNNQLSSIVVTKCIGSLLCSYNQISYLDLSECDLWYLRCDNNPLYECYNLSNQRNLYSLNCSNTQISSSLDLSGFSELTSLSCCETNISALDISGNTKLEQVNCGDCKHLISLDATGCSSLKMLFCDCCKLALLSISGCSSLQHLWCTYNQLTSLDLSGCDALSNLLCYNNPITQEITVRPQSFLYDRRYAYSITYEGEVIWQYAKDDHTGWYYPGEPEKGYHGW